MDTAMGSVAVAGGDSVPVRRWRVVVRTLGELLLTAGVVILLFVGYELWWTGRTTRHDQHVLTAELHQQWSQPRSTAQRHNRSPTLAAPPFGSGIAILRIPRFGPKYAFVVVQGTSTADLIKGPGHYPGSALPGQIGNFAVAGHRTTYLHPFYDINELRRGDPIVVETRTKWFTYTVENIPHTTARHQEVVSPSDLQVAYAVPDQPNPDTVPTQRVLTLTSCNPRFSAAQRIVVHALLTNTTPKAAGVLPPALTAGDS